MAKWTFSVHYEDVYAGFRKKWTFLRNIFGKVDLFSALLTLFTRVSEKSGPFMKTFYAGFRKKWTFSRNIFGKVDLFSTL